MKKLILILTGISLAGYLTTSFAKASSDGGGKVDQQSLNQNHPLPQKKNHVKQEEPKQKFQQILQEVV